MEHPIIALDVRCIGDQNTGDTTYWSGLVTGLVQLDSKFRYLLFSNKPRPPEIPGSDRFRWIELPSRNNRWWSLVSFPVSARRMGASLLHTQYTLSPFAKKGITTVHDVSFFIGPQWFKAKDRMLLQRTVPASVKRAIKVITVSETSRRDIERYIPAARGKLTVTPLALSPAVKKPESNRVDDMGIEGPFLLTVGTRWPRKNMNLAMEAAELLPSSMPHRLAVTGKRGWHERAKGARTITTGWVTDEQLSRLYAAASLYLVPSFYEGFGLTLLEAFACGCPVLASSGGSLPEVAGDAAEIEASWQPRQWALTIERLLADSSKLAQMRDRGYARVGRFSWKRTAKLTEEAYREALR